MGIYTRRCIPYPRAVVNVMDNKPRFYGECDDDIRPDILVAYHELPNMYDEEFLSLES